jgi:peptidyl-prolyl cis-trans isomerase SurA
MKPRFVKDVSPLVRLCCLLLLLAVPSPVRSQTSPNSETAARVGGFEIRGVRVEAYLQQTVPGWPLEGEQQAQARAAATEHLVNRQLVLLALRQQGIKSTPAELEWKLDEVRAELQRVGRQLDEHLQVRQQTEEELRNDFDWELSWSKYLAQTLTDERLSKHFEARPRDFDGTELHVAQILLPAEPSAEQGGGLPTAEKLRRELVEGQVEWSVAVRRHSISPSRERDGDLGWIRRREPMPEEFSRVAFTLGEGEISLPHTSRFGVHLIKCLEVRPGKRQLGDVRSEVYRAAMEEEFRRLAAEMRSKVEVWIRPQD